MTGPEEQSRELAELREVLPLQLCSSTGVTRLVGVKSLWILQLIGLIFFVLWEEEARYCINCLGIYILFHLIYCKMWAELGW